MCICLRFVICSLGLYLFLISIISIENEVVNAANALSALEYAEAINPIIKTTPRKVGKLPLVAISAYNKSARSGIVIPF